jgi:hypothetical protein
MPNTDNKFEALVNQTVVLHDGDKVVSRAVMGGKTLFITRLKFIVGTPAEVDAKIAELKLKPKS